MQALPASEGVLSYSGPRDKPRRSDMVTELEIDCRMPGQQVGMHLLRAGVQTVQVWAKEVPGILAQAWRINGEINGDAEEELIAEAQEAFDRNLDRETYQANSTYRVDGKVLTTGIVRDVRRKHASGESLTEDEQAVWKLRCTASEVTGDSMEAQFDRANLRGIRPLRSVRVVQDKIPNPDEQEQLEWTAKAAQIVGQAGDNSVLRAQIAELQQQIRELMAGGGRRRRRGSEPGDSGDE